MVGWCFLWWINQRESVWMLCWEGFKSINLFTSALSVNPVIFKLERLFCQQKMYKTVRIPTHEPHNCTTQQLKYKHERRIKRCTLPHIIFVISTTSATFPRYFRTTLHCVVNFMIDNSNITVQIKCYSYFLVVDDNYYRIMSMWQNFLHYFTWRRNNS